VLDPREREHMLDVHHVFLEFFLVVGVAIVVLVVTGLAMRDRMLFWRSVAGGAAVLSGAVVFLGILFALFFDSMFDLFPRLFFPPGSYDFNPLTERLVQLFPDDFWSETSMGLAVVVLVLSLAVTWFAFRRLSAAAERAHPRDSSLASIRRAGTT